MSYEAQYYEMELQVGEWKKKYRKLQKEFEQWKKESIKWSVEDFTTLEVDGYEISDQQAQEALEDMIHHHDCTIGITWDTLNYYLEQYGKQVETGKEAWRKCQDQ